MNNELRNPSELSRVYKVTFNNGDTHYGRVVSSKNYSAKTYLVEQSRKLKYNTNNPLRMNMTTEVEKRICNEYETTICEIVFEGLTSEAIKFKDEVSKNDSNSLNMKTNVLMGERRDMLKVPMKYSKVIKSVGGETITYINNGYAKLHKLVKFLDETKRHPLDGTFARVLVPIERY
jgi:hypothetical protein